MKISTKGRYGLRILLDIALYKTGGKPRIIREIAANQEISEKYISRLIVDLRKAGFVKSVRGTNGGYILSRRPGEIRILDVVEVMEGPLSIVNCTEPGDRSCRRAGNCPAQQLWREINGKFRAVLAEYTLQDLLDFYVSSGGEILDYCI